MTTIIATLKLEPRYYNKDQTRDSRFSMKARIQILVGETDYPKDGIQNVDPISLILLAIR